MQIWVQICLEIDACQRNLAVDSEQIFRESHSMQNRSRAPPEAAGISVDALKPQNCLTRVRGVLLTPRVHLELLERVSFARRLLTRCVRFVAHVLPAVGGGRHAKQLARALHAG